MWTIVLRLTFFVEMTVGTRKKTVFGLIRFFLLWLTSTPVGLCIETSSLKTFSITTIALDR